MVKYETVGRVDKILNTTNNVVEFIIRPVAEYSIGPLSSPETPHVAENLERTTKQTLLVGYEDREVDTLKRGSFEFVAATSQFVSRRSKFRATTPDLKDTILKIHRRGKIVKFTVDSYKNVLEVM